MESAGISRPPSRGVKTYHPNRFFFLFFFLISLPPILWSIHLTLLGLFGSFLAQRGPALKRQLSRAIVVSLLRVQSWPFKPSENYTGSIFFARSRVIHLSTISLSLSRGLDGLSFSRFNASFQCSLRNSTVYWPTRHGNVSKPPTNGMVALRVGHARMHAARTDHIFTPRPRIRGVRKKKKEIKRTG